MEQQKHPNRNLKKAIKLRTIGNSLLIVWGIAWIWVLIHKDTLYHSPAYRLTSGILLALYFSFSAAASLLSQGRKTAEFWCYIALTILGLINVIGHLIDFLH